MTHPNMIGAYGPWAASLVDNGPAKFSFRRDEWADIDVWRQAARQQLLARLASPDTGDTPSVTVKEQFIYDDLHVEHLSWQQLYGPPTEAI